MKSSTHMGSLISQMLTFCIFYYWIAFSYTIIKNPKNNYIVDMIKNWLAR